ncbi:FAD binding domain-containing protein [Sarocladium implicatum]|nr:FAD binding domain-containing protein [Sarocladium implicatum]
MAQTIVIVGGSVAGLLHGLLLKRDGHNVTILEKDPRSLRSSHNAGCAFRGSMIEYLEKYDDTGLASTTQCKTFSARIHPHPKVFDKTVKRPLPHEGFENTSWGVLYRLLRANFDGFPSIPYPQPPPARAGDGAAVYLTGKSVTDLKLKEDKVTVYYTEGGASDTKSLEADLVIAADGLRSTVRDIVNAPAVSQYSGFVAWRGVVPERDLEPGTVEFFNKNYTYDLMSRTYILCYSIPTDDGGLGDGQKLVNWCWYTNVAEGSEEMNEIFTDRHGRLHANTVGQGDVSPAVWKRVRATGTKKMSPPLVELLNKTEEAFVTKVNDLRCPKARYLDGRVLLVGDALTTPRSNIAQSIEQAGNHALWLSQAMRGEISMDDWEKKVCTLSERLYLFGRLASTAGLASWFTFFKCVWRYLSFLLKARRTKS